MPMIHKREIVKLNERYKNKDELIIDEQVRLAMKGGPKRTSITIVDHDTGEVLDEGHNRILVPGSQSSACKQFGIEPAVLFPTYNSELELENSYPDWSHEPENEPLTCLWCVGQSGYLTSPGEVIAVDNKDRIAPIKDIIPFRFCDAEEDLTPAQREIYFGRKTDPDTGKIAYYFKRFDTEPQLHVIYLDGTEVGPDMWSVQTPQDIEVYVEMKLGITRTDLREYFDQVIGWDNAYVNTLSLCTSWYRDDISENPDAEPSDVVSYKWYQDIIPFSKFNFTNKDLKELNKAIDFIYRVYY